jgi:tRNA(Ile)-lysidine synthase TilS/MesJ
VKNERARLQNILSHLRRADQDFGMINNGDRVAVGVSGGKDSLLLLRALADYRRFDHKKFELIAITVDCTNGQCDFSALTKFCADLDVKFVIEPSNIFEIVFDIRKEKNPCSLCSKLRRGILHTAAVREGCNRVALGHHGDDLIETLFLSMCYEGRLSTFQPTSYLDRTNVTIIRPFIYLSERDIAAFESTLPILINPCPVNHHTQREYMKNLVKGITKDIPIARDRMLDAITCSERYNLFPTKKPTVR